MLYVKKALLICAFATNIITPMNLSNASSTNLLHCIHVCTLQSQTTVLGCQIVHRRLTDSGEARLARCTKASVQLYKDMER